VPLGLLSAPGTIAVDKESGQVADTVVAENISKMWARLYAPCRRNAVWLINQDIESQLDQLKFLVKNVAGTENVGGWPLYTPPGGLSSTPYGTLKGRPVLPTQACNTLGDKGDIILTDLSWYLAALKTGGVRSDVSLHLWFDLDKAAFKFVLRMGGQPWLSAPISPRSGSITLSSCVTLAERA